MLPQINTSGKLDDIPHVVGLGAIIDYEIKMMGLFKSETHLLLMLILVCNADINK